MIWLSSDHHFENFGVIKNCNRPFSSVEEMNETLIKNWNSVINKQDIIYYLGDFSFGKYANNLKIFNRLNGKQKILIKGNHCKNNVLKLPWTSIHDIFNLKHNGQLYVLCHYAMRTWNKSYHGSRHLYGHSHNKLPPFGLSFDIGVDAWNYFPVSIDQVEEKMKTLTPVKEVYDE